MEATRKGIFFPGSEDIAGYPTLSVSEQEIITANIENLAAWVGLDDWDIQPEDDRFLDRVSDEPYYTRAAVSVSGNYAAASDGSTVYTIPNVSSGIVIPDFDTSGSFTIAVLCEQAIALGSSSEATSSDEERAWYMISGTEGGANENELQVIYAGLNNSYNSPALNDAGWNVVLLEIDKPAGEINISVNGEEITSLQNSLITERTVLNELTFGVVHAEGAGETIRPDQYLGAALAFDGKLSSQEKANVIKMLSDKVGL